MEEKCSLSTFAGKRRQGRQRKWRERRQASRQARAPQRSTGLQIRLRLRERRGGKAVVRLWFRRGGQEQERLVRFRVRGLLLIVLLGEGIQRG